MVKKNTKYIKELKQATDMFQQMEDRLLKELEQSPANARAAAELESVRHHKAALMARLKRLTAGAASRQKPQKTSDFENDG